jgi:hypothetical protein
MLIKDAHDAQGPLPVVIVSSKNADTTTRMSPFTWVVPLNKRGAFMIMMRPGSITLENVTRWMKSTEHLDARVVLSWLRASYSIAQNVRMMTAPNRVSLTGFQPEGWWGLSIPNVYLHAVLAKPIGIMQPFELTGETGDDCHYGVVVEAVTWKTSSRANPDEPPVMFTKGRTFWSARQFDIPGY